MEIPVCESGNYAARSHAINTASTLFFAGAVSGATALLVSIAALAVCRGRRLFFIGPMAVSAFFVYWGALAGFGTALACAFS